MKITPEQFLRLCFGIIVGWALMFAAAMEAMR